MRSIRLLAALAGTLALLVTLIATGSAGAAPGGGAHASVIGGSTAKIEEYPWLAYVEGNLDGGGFPFSCTGTVVAPRVVLTAGHCVEDLEVEIVDSPRGYLVATGTANHRHIPREHLSRVTRALVYPGFRPSFVHGDAGLLILKRPSAAPAIPLAGPGDAGLLASGTPIEIAGWGLSDFHREDGPALLQRASLTVQDAARCRRGGTELHHHFSPGLQLCALDAPGFTMSGCFGDSGGPAIAHRADGSPVQIGIISSGGFKCEPRVPNLYTRVDRVSQWASEWIAAIETGAPAPPVASLRPPTMHLVEARFLAARAIGEDFTKTRRGDLEESVTAECSRVARSKFRCHVRWRRGDGRYFGTVVVFYTPHKGALTWNDGYTIHRVSESCLRSGSRAECPVRTRKRAPGSPKPI